ncbi:MAG: hypothetical protein JKY37_04625 [Nannocystaceae bacterium]|nr:hypothetical protein [Nannocystaceae bacterium]
MVTFRVFRPLVVVLSLAAACKGDAGAGSPTPTPIPETSATPAPDSPAADDGSPGDPSPHREVAALLASIGEGPALAFVVRPAKWDAARATITDLLGEKAPPEIRAVLGAATVSDVLEQVGKQILGLNLAALEGIDQTRPWVAGLGEAPVASPGLPNAYADPAGHRSLGLRQVVLVPVTDGAAFIASLEPAMAPHLRPLKGWVAEGGPVYAAQLDDEGYVVVSVQGGYARVVVFSQVTGMTPAEARKALAPRLSAKPVAAVQTPALVELGRRDSLAAMHVRPWHLRDLATFFGTYSMMRAVATVTPDQRATALAFGISSLLVAETVMVDEGLELDDWGWMLEAKGTQAQLLGVGSLTPHGREVFDAAATTVALLPAVKTEAAALEGFVRLDITRGWPPYRRTERYRNSARRSPPRRLPSVDRCAWSTPHTAHRCRCCRQPCRGCRPNTRHCPLSSHCRAFFRTSTDPRAPSR